MKQKQFNHLVLNQPLSLPTRIDSPEGRTYATPSGGVYPSITTVLGWKFANKLDSWKAKVGEEEAERIKNAAAARGTKFHNLCEHYLHNNEVLTAGLDFMTLDMFIHSQSIIDRIDNIRGVELQMYSDYLRVAGTADVIAEFDGVRSVIDFKTSTRLKKEDWIESYFMQTAVYCVMYEELYGVPIGQIVIIIAVENENPQLFVKKRDQYIGAAMKVIREYEQRFTIT